MATIAEGLRESAKRLVLDGYSRSYFEACRDNSIEMHKSSERTKVLDFLTEHHSRQFSLKMLSLPGMKWTAEEIMLERFTAKGKKPLCIGFERVWTILEWGLRFMPGRERINIASTNFTGVASESAFMFYHDIAGMPITPTLGETANTPEKTVRLSSILRRFTCVWIDLMGPICTLSNAIMLRALPQRIRKGCPVPMAFTFLFGRDTHVGLPSEEPLERRVIGIKRELDKSKRGEFEPVKAWRYRGLNDSPMATVCGVFRRSR